MLQQSARGCFKIAKIVGTLRLSTACTHRQYPFTRTPQLGMAQKSITAFFKGPEKRKATDDSALGADKKQKERRLFPAMTELLEYSAQPAMLNSAACCRWA